MATIAQIAAANPASNPLAAAVKSTPATTNTVLGNPSTVPTQSALTVANTPLPAPKTVSPAVITAAPAVAATKSTIAKVNAASDQIAAQAALKPQLSNGQTAAQLAETAGVNQGAVMAQTALGVNPDAAVGGALNAANRTVYTPPPATPTPAPAASSSYTQDQASAIWKLNGGDATGWTPNSDGTWKAPAEMQSQNQSSTTNTTSGNTGTYQDKLATAAADFQKNSEANQAAAQAEYDDYKTKVQAIQDGTVPLTPDQQEQLDNIKGQFQSLMDQQQRANQAYEAAVRVSGVRSGRDMYAPRVNAGNVQAAIAQGVQKVTEINSKMVSAISQAKQAFQDNDFKALDRLHAAWNDFQTQKSQALKDTYQTVKDTIEAGRQQHSDDLEDAKFNFDVQQYLDKPARDLDALDQKTIIDWSADHPDANIDPVHDSYNAAQEKVMNSESFKQKQAQDYSGTVGEYQFYAKQEIANGKTPVGFLDFIRQKSSSASGDITGDVVGTTGSSAIDSGAEGYTSAAVPGAGGLTQAAIDQAALQYALTGQMPSVGMGSSGAAGEKRTAIQNRAAEIANNTTISSNKAQLDSLNKSLATQTDYANTTERAVSNADAAFDQLLGAFSNSGINTSQSSLLNKSLNTIAKNLTGGDINAFNAGLTEVANEYTQVFSRGGQISDVNKKKAADILNGNISLGDLKKVQNELQAQGQIVVDGAKNQQAKIVDQINSIISGRTLSTSGDAKNKVDTSDPDFQDMKKSYPDLSDQEIWDSLGKTNVGSDTNNAPDLKKVVAAIGKFESGGDYQATGKITAKGDKAYGKYQVMGANVPSWTKEATGKSMTIQQFLNDPEAQDKVAEHYLGMHLKKYGNLADVASIWFSGLPIAKAGNSKDVNGTTVPDYVKNVQSIYDRLS